MSEASFASLGPTLLARKGGAKPAMRPQLAPLPGVVPPEAEQLEDLGWNDMGQDDAASGASTNDNIVSIIPNAQDEETGDDMGTHSPLVRDQQRRLAEHIEGEAATAPIDAPVDEPGPVPAIKKTPKAKAASSRRAAFTLRLDADRHLKLRLAATMQGVSAQALVTDVLDALLSDIEELYAIAHRMKHN